MRGGLFVCGGREAMFHVLDGECHVFMQFNPCDDGYDGEVEEVEFLYPPSVHEWPEGSSAPTPCLGNPQQFRVFRDNDELTKCGYSPIHSWRECVRWSDYLAGGESTKRGT